MVDNPPGALLALTGAGRSPLSHWERKGEHMAVGMLIDAQGVTAS
jgi:hypothetical protein